MPSKLKMTIICLHISTVLYVLVTIILGFILCSGVGLETNIIMILMAAISLFMIIFIEIVVFNLKKYRFWAWVTGIALCGLYIPSIFIVLGGLGLWGLLDNETREKFITKEKKNEGISDIV